MPLAELLMERFKVRTRPVQNPLNVVSIGIDPELILPNNPNRLGFIIINLSANIVMLALTREVSVTAGAELGIRLNANGGSYVCVWDEDFDMTAWEWWGVASVADSRIFALEIVEY